MKTKIQIKSMLGEILFEVKTENNSIKKTIEKAVKQRISLDYANLDYANLDHANLYHANLVRANLGHANLYYANLDHANLVRANVAAYCKSDLSLLKFQKTTLVAFKYLKKNLRSPYRHFQYEIGKTYHFDCDQNIFNLCGKDGNIASIEWCLRETQGNIEDYIYVEVEFDPQNLVVPFCSDGKFRVSEFKITRALGADELKPLLQPVK